MKLPEFGGKFSVKMTDSSYPNYIAKCNDDEKYTKIRIQLGDVTYEVKKEDMVGFHFDKNKLAEAVVTYAYASKNLGALLLEGKTKNNLKICLQKTCKKY